MVYKCNTLILINNSNFKLLINNISLIINY